MSLTSAGGRHADGGAMLPPPDEAQKALDDNKAKLHVPGATKAYVGWRFDNNWITHERSIVVLARRSDVGTVRSHVPGQIGGFRVEVRPDPRPPRSHADRATAMLLSAEPGTIRDEFAVPRVPGEVSFEDEQLTEIAAARAAKPHVNYEAPVGVNLDAITAEMKLVLHVSPEQGWAQLRSFLTDVTRGLVVGMYEFTAPHIVDAVLNALRSPDKLTLTLDSPAAKGTREQTVEDTEKQLSNNLSNRLTFAWALSGLGRESVAIEFPTAYHIKVAVKDGKSFWLSSGNWNTSNQPNIDPSDQTALAQAARTHDRDWHVICECPKLAVIFGKYLMQDNKTAAAQARTVGAVATGMAAAAGLVLEQPEELLVSARAPKVFFAPHTVSGTIKVKPLLTPDDYRKPILQLIQNAKKRFYMQTQYIHTVDSNKDQGNPTHMQLIGAVVDLIKRGVDVRLIASEYQDHMWIERLQDAGVDAVEHLRIQPHVHNKGIVVDSEITVVSSQNWSAEGTGNNRDAGLIIYNAEAAQYFETIFLHDWSDMAASKVLR